MRRDHSSSCFHSFLRSACIRRGVRTASSGNVRNGYTLLEVLLALMVILVLATVASSPLLNTWRDNRLSEAAEDVRSLLAGSRIRSLDNDETWQFRYEPGGTLFVRVPAGTNEGPAVETTQSGRLSGTLPEGMTFSAEPAIQSSGSRTQGTAISPDLFAGLPDAAALTQAGWSEPIHFYSDGTADETAFELTDEYGGVRRISVRDLTGAVSVSKQGTPL